MHVKIRFMTIGTALDPLLDPLASLFHRLPA